MSPLFVRYCTNTHHTCELVYCLLTSPREEATLHKIQEKLDEYVDLESYHHGELEVMADFRRTLLLGSGGIDHPESLRINHF